MEHSKVTYGLTQKGKPKLIFKKQFYILDKKRPSGREYWKCVNPKCPGRLSMLPNGTPVVTVYHLVSEVSAVE